MKPTLNSEDLETVRRGLDDSTQAFNTVYPGPKAGRQPVHTVYGGAQLYKASAAKKLGELALRSLAAYAPDAATLAAVTECKNADVIYARVIKKLETEAVEDQRIDFEDGYGSRANDEEDGHVIAAAQALAAGIEADDLPPYIGFRIKSFTPEARDRAIRSLDLFMTSLAKAADGRLPKYFVVTLPKVSHAGQISALAELLAILEQKLGYEDGWLKLEFMVETTQAIIGPDGRTPLLDFVAAANGRCVAAHFGTYDYTAACGITAAQQTHDHPAADHARAVMQAALSDCGIFLSDGATTQMPVGPHRGADLSADQLAENQQAVHDAWKLHYDNVSRSLAQGFYQGWDLNPAQIPMRYAAVYNFFLSSYDDAAKRLKSFIDKAAQATLVGSTFDDAATGQGLLNYFIRGRACGALTDEEVLSTGITLNELECRSFAQIVSNRSAQ